MTLERERTREKREKSLKERQKSRQQSMGDEEGATGSSQSSLSFKEGQRGGGDGGGGLRSLISRSASHRSVSSVTDQEGGSEHGSQNGASTQNMARTLSSASIASTSSVVSRRSVTTGVLHDLCRRLITGGMHGHIGQRGLLSKTPCSTS